MSVSRGFFLIRSLLNSRKQSTFVRIVLPALLVAVLLSLIGFTAKFSGLGLAAFSEAGRGEAGGYGPVRPENSENSVSKRRVSSLGPVLGAGRTAFGFEPFQGCTLDCTATVPANGGVGTPVNFQATANAQGCPTQPIYDWNFGDGSARSNQQNPSKTYNSAGTYPWTLTVSVNTGTTLINTVAGGFGEGDQASKAPFGNPVAIARDPQGRGVFVATVIGGYNLIRFINTTAADVSLAGRVIQPGTVRTVAGGGFELGENSSALQTDVGNITGLGVSSNGNILYYLNQVDGNVRAINLSTSNITVAGQTVSQGNVGTLAAQFGGNVNGLTVNPTSGDVFVADASPGINKVFKIDNAGNKTEVAGNGSTTTKADDVFSGGNALNVPLLQPRGLAIDGSGNLIIADTGHYRVIRVDGGGTATLVNQYSIQGGINPYPTGLAVQGANIYAANGNQQTVTRLTNGFTTLAGSTICDYSNTNCGDGGAAGQAGFYFLGSTGTPPLAGLAPHPSGLFILDQGITGKGRVRFLNLTGGTVTIAGINVLAGAIDTIAGNGLATPYDGGLATGSTFSSPVGMTLDNNGNMWVSDTLSAKLRFINRGASATTIFPNTEASQVVPAGSIVTVNKDVGSGAGDGVTVNKAGFDSPQGLFATANGIYVADSKSGPTVPLQVSGRRTSLIRFINTTAAPVTIFPGSPSAITIPAGQIAKIAGGGESANTNGDNSFALNAKFIGASDIVVTSNGTIFVADVGQKAVRKIDGNTGIVTSLTLPAAQYTGLGLDSTGRLYIANYDGGTILRENSTGSGTFSSMVGSLTKPRDVAVGSDGTAYVTVAPASRTAGNHQIYAVSSTGTPSIIAGGMPGFGGDGGVATSAMINISPSELVVGSGATNQLPQTVNIAVRSNGDVFFADTNNNRIRQLSQNMVTCVKTGSITIAGNNPVPQLTSLSPNNKLIDSAAFDLVITGSGFIPASVIKWNGQNRPTTFNSGTQIVAAIPATDLLNAGNVSVTVLNPTPGGGTSNTLTFTVIAPNPVPQITTISPNTAVEGSPSFTLTVNGTGFVSGSVVRWDGQDRPTTFVNATQLTAAIQSSDLSGTGIASVSVFSPLPGGGISNLVNFSITAANNPAPTLTSISPSSGVAGGADFNLTVNGTNFVATSKVRWNGADRSTTYVNATQLVAVIGAGDIGAQGTAQVTVFSPTPGGGVTAALTFTINAPAPTLSSMSPNNAVAGGAAFNLTANGANFVSSSKVRWNGQDRSTTFINSTQLTATILPSDIPSAGTAQVTVFTPTPGGGTSSALTFTINPAPTPPVMSNLNPGIVTFGGAAFTLTVNGSNFVNGAVVRVNGTARTTTFVSASQVTAAIPATDIASATNLIITAINPGSTVSNSLTLPVVSPLANLSAASFFSDALAPNSIVAMFGAGLTTGSVFEVPVPLPTILQGTKVVVKDSAGVERDAPLFIISPGQINYLMPSGTAQGTATISVVTNNVITGYGQVLISNLAPGIFSANSSGAGVAAAYAIKVVGTNQILQFLFEDGPGGKVPVPIDLGAPSDQVFVVLFGTGFRTNSGLGGVSVKINGTTVGVDYAGLSPDYVGLDQINLKPLPRSLIGAGVSNIVITIDGKVVNTVQMAIK